MKKILTTLIGLVAVTSMVQAQACPEANYDRCASDGYEIVEAEPNTYWPHNQMEAAHWVGYHFNTRKTVRRVRHRRVHRRRHTCR